MEDCPYCDVENDVSGGLDEFEGDAFDWECENCGKDFEVTVEFEPVFSTSKIVVEECEVCGKDERDPFEKGRVLPWPTHLKENVVCKRCYLTASGEELRSSNG